MLESELVASYDAARALLQIFAARVWGEMQHAKTGTTFRAFLPAVNPSTVYKVAHA